MATRYKLYFVRPTAVASKEGNSASGYFQVCVSGEGAIAVSFGWVQAGSESRRFSVGAVPWSRGSPVWRWPGSPRSGSRVPCPAGPGALSRETARLWELTAPAAELRNAPVPVILCLHSLHVWCFTKVVQSEHLCCFNTLYFFWIYDLQLLSDVLEPDTEEFYSVDCCITSGI